jgi:predicted dehydrogenase
MSRSHTKPRLGFLGVGWIGRARMEALLHSGRCEAAAICEPDAGMADGAVALAPDAVLVGSLEEMLTLDLDGVVIATPSALHASQSISALDSGRAVFCQKPLGRSAAEVCAVVEAARRANCLLGLDLSYRHTNSMQEIRRLIGDGALGEIHSVDLVFHNGYGPDKPWFYDRTLSGGGCLVDLGIHLADLALWALDFPQIASIEGHLKTKGAPWQPQNGMVEDLAFATLVTDAGTVIRLACSWHLNVGRDAEISATFHGTNASARFANVDGSFYDFEAHRLQGTTSAMFASGPDDWGPRAALSWLDRLSHAPDFQAEALEFERVARVLEAIYSSAAAPRPVLDAGCMRG